MEIQARILGKHRLQGAAMEGGAPSNVPVSQNRHNTIVIAKGHDICEQQQGLLTRASGQACPSWQKELSGTNSGYQHSSILDRFNGRGDTAISGTSIVWQPQKGDLQCAQAGVHMPQQDNGASLLLRFKKGATSSHRPKGECETSEDMTSAQHKDRDIQTAYQNSETVTQVGGEAKLGQLDAADGEGISDLSAMQRMPVESAVTQPHVRSGVPEDWHMPVPLRGTHLRSEDEGDALVIPEAAQIYNSRLSAASAGPVPQQDDRGPHEERRGAAGEHSIRPALRRGLRDHSAQGYFYDQSGRKLLCIERATSLGPKK